MNRSSTPAGTIPPPSGEPSSKTTPVSRLPFDELQQLLDNTSAVIGVKDRDGRYVFVNRRFVDVLGGEAAADYLGRTDAELFPPALARRLRQNDLLALREGQEVVFEEAMTLDGVERTFLTRKFPLFDAGGRACAVALIASDTTDAKRTEEALRNIALGVSAVTGRQVFERIVNSLAAALGVDCAFVTRLETGADPTLVALAAWYAKGIDGPTRFLVRHTPCEHVLERGFVYLSGDAQQAYPKSTLADYGFVSYAGYPLRDAARQPIGVLSICHRAALAESPLVESMLRIFAVRAAAELERARADEAWRLSEASYRTIFEAAEDAIFVHDLDTGRIVDINPKVCATYGYSRDELLALEDLSVLGSGVEPYTAADAARHLARARDGEVVRVEWHRRNKDGSLHWDEVCLKRVQLAGVDRILAFTREVTERKVREEALARSEDRLKATIEAALDCIVTMDAAGRVIGFNPAAETCFGFTAEDALGRPLAELIIPERFRRAHEEGLQRYLREGDGPFLGRRVEVIALRKDGTEFPVELAVGLAKGQDGDIFIGYLRDITDHVEFERRREQLEAQLRQAQKMEAIGHLAGGIAHDFNNILTGVMGYLVLARQRAETLGDATLLGFLDRSHESGQHAAELIQQLLTFSRGRGARPRALDLAPVVEKSAELLRSTMPSSLEMKLEVSADAGLVLADPVQIEQVLMNLCINARDAMQGVGAVRVELREAWHEKAICASCRGDAHGRWIELSVRDAGPGIAPDALERIFEPFYTTKETGRGSGMGLAIVHGIVHQWGGHVAVEAVPRGGTTFRVLLPVATGARAEDAAARPRAGLAPKRLRGRVLVAEDKEEVRGFMCDLLSTWGLEVSAFGSPLEAAAAVSVEPGAFDAAIVDYVMPRLNGMELARRLRVLRSDLPVILYTGYAEALSEEQLRSLNILGPLRKPLDTAQLFALLEAAIGGD